MRKLFSTLSLLALPFLATSPAEALDRLVAVTFAGAISAEDCSATGAVTDPAPGEDRALGCIEGVNGWDPMVRSLCTLVTAFPKSLKGDPRTYSPNAGVPYIGVFACKQDNFLAVQALDKYFQDRCDALNGVGRSVRNQYDGCDHVLGSDPPAPVQ